MTGLIPGGISTLEPYSMSFNSSKAQNSFPMKFSVFTIKIMGCLIFQSCVSCEGTTTSDQLT